MCRRFRFLPSRKEEVLTRWKEMKALEQNSTSKPEDGNWQEDFQTRTGSYRLPKVYDLVHIFARREELKKSILLSHFLHDYLRVLSPDEGDLACTISSMKEENSSDQKSWEIMTLSFSGRCY